MINVKYTLRNVELGLEQKELLKGKIERKFKKYHEDLNFDVKLVGEKGRYIINVMGSFKKHQIETKDEGYDLLKIADIAIKKVAAQIQKVESKLTNY